MGRSLALPGPPAALGGRYRRRRCRHDVRARRPRRRRVRGDGLEPFGGGRDLPWPGDGPPARTDRRALADPAALRAADPDQGRIPRRGTNVARPSPLRRRLADRWTRPVAEGLPRRMRSPRPSRSPACAPSSGAAGWKAGRPRPVRHPAQVHGALEGAPLPRAGRDRRARRPDAARITSRGLRRRDPRDRPDGRGVERAPSCRPAPSCACRATRSARRAGRPCPRRADARRRTRDRRATAACGSRSIRRKMAQRGRRQLGTAERFPLRPISSLFPPNDLHSIGISPPNSRHGNHLIPVRSVCPEL